MMWLIKFLISCLLDIELIVWEGVDCVFVFYILIFVEVWKMYVGELEVFDEVIVNLWKIEEKI